jgi:hypothetical protein
MMSNAEGSLGAITSAFCLVGSFGARASENARCRRWSEAQVAEAVHLATMMGLYNRMANAFGLPSQNLLALKS